MLNALFIHGVGEQKFSFADDARQWMKEGAAERGLKYKPVVSWWAPFADKVEQAFEADVKKRGSAMGPLQSLTSGTLTDALFYQSSPELRQTCMDLLDINVRRFEGQPFTCFAHSLGCLIFTDWLRQRPQTQPVTLVTMGCNLSLFYQGRTWAPIPQLARPNSWVNVFTARDMLGFPVGGLVPGVHDVRVRLGGLLGWTGFSHISYWGSRPLWKKTLPKLLGL